MKKLFLLLVVIPFLGAAQTTLVKWFRSDLQPTLIENHVTATPLTGAVHREYWSEDAFYITNGNYSNSSSPDAAKYIQFTLSPETGYQIKPSTFSFSVRKNGGEDVQKIQVKFSKNADFSNAQTLLGETVVAASYSAYNPSFPVNTVATSGETIFVRLYVYNTYNDLHLQHNQSGSIGPAISGDVSLFTALKPVTVDDHTGTLKNSSLNIDILSNDNYVSSGALNKITATKPTHGTVVVNNVKDVTYIPDSNYVGYDSFYYTITNAVGESNAAKVEIQVLDGSETVLERWNKTDFTPVNYITGITGSSVQTAGGMSINNFSQWISSISYNTFLFNGLSTSTNLNGTLDPTKYIQFSVQSTLTEKAVVLRKLNFQYNAQGTGNFTVKYSKDPSFTNNVYTLANHKSFTESAYAQWFDLDENFAAGTVIYPNEKIYVRVYVYNASYSSASFYIKTGVANDATIINGPIITGIIADLHTEPCSKTVTWNGTAWSEAPTIDKKAVINGNYNTSENGSFSACNLVINSGKLTIGSQNSVTIYNEIKVATGAFLEVENNGNLIQVNNGAGANVGQSTVLRDITIGKARTQYNYIGSPVAFADGQNMKTIYPGMSSVLSYNEWDNMFSDSNGIVPAGKGLALQEPTVAGVPAINTKVTAKFKGVPQNGVINYLLAHTGAVNSASSGYNLLANPYPSNINLKQLYELNKGSGNMSSTIYLWDNVVNYDVAQTQQGSSYSGQAYAVFNAVAGKAGTGTSAAGYLNNNVIGKKVPSNILGIGQGFLVQTMVKNQNFRFDNSVRTSLKAETEFLGKNAQFSEDEDDRFWLKMITPANLTTSSAVVYFQGGSTAFGQDDSEAGGASDELFSIVEQKNLSVNGRPAFNKSDKIELGSQHFVAGNYTIAIEKAEGIFTNEQNIYLKDKTTGIITNLSAGSYTFSADAGVNTGRFEIIYEGQTTLATDTATKEEIVVYKQSGDFVVKASSKKITALDLYDMSGRLVYQAKPNATKVVVNSSQLNSGVYLIKIQQGETTTARKVIK